MTFLIARSAIAGAVVLFGFQMPSAPPMKMGLWEQTTTVHMKMSGAQMPAGMPTDITSKTHSCYTPETWTKILANNSNKSCTFSNQSIVGSHLSLDISCSGQATIKVHIDGVFTNMETGHGTVHMDMNSPQMNMASDSTYETHFINSNCGSVGPGKTELIH